MEYMVSISHRTINSGQQKLLICLLRPRGRRDDYKHPSNHKKGSGSSCHSEGCEIQWSQLLRHRDICDCEPGGTGSSCTSNGKTCEERKYCGLLSWVREGQQASWRQSLDYHCLSGKWKVPKKRWKVYPEVSTAP